MVGEKGELCRLSKSMKNIDRNFIKNNVSNEIKLKICKPLHPIKIVRFS